MQKSWRAGKYEMLEIIGRGGMAEVWRARFFGDNGFVKDVAVKRILPELSKNCEIVSMFFDEALALVKLKHQNIVEVYELFESQRGHFIAMELLDGVDLRRLMQASSSKRLPIRTACFIVAQVLKALEHAHQLGIIHRDISPQNILVSFNGEVKVADFGIAKGDHRSTETIVGNVRGKFAYMPPEQLSGSGLDHRCDIYALGAVFYELVCPSGTRDDRFQSVPREIRPVLRRALKTRPEERYRSAGEFLNDLFAVQKIYGLISHEHELALLVRERFRGEFKKMQERRRQIRPVGKMAPFKKFALTRRTITCSALSVLFFASFGVIGADSPYKKELIDVATAVVDIQAETNGSDSGPKPKTDRPERRSSDDKRWGLLSVSARPWGYLIIDDNVAKGTETPVVGRRISAGRHKIEIFFESVGKKFSRYLDVEPEHTISCFADAKNDDGLACKAIK